MAGFQVEFKPWRRFQAIRDDALIQRWLQLVGERTHGYFRARMQASRGGRIYRRRGGAMHRASAPGAYPAIMTGALVRSIRKRVTAREVEIGSNVFYARYLKNGTRKMAKRKMSSDALRETLPGLRGQLRGFARWRRM